MEAAAEGLGRDGAGQLTHHSCAHWGRHIGWCVCGRGDEVQWCFERGIDSGMSKLICR